jgi:hypothetical protein
LTKENKEKYIGMFKNGLKCGKGSQIDANGDKFEGYFESKLINITTVKACEANGSGGHFYFFKLKHGTKKFKKRKRNIF